MRMAFLSKYQDMGLLLLRCGLGAMLLTEGAVRLVAGPTGWARFGRAMGAVGVDFWPALWGFIFAFAESFGAVFLIIGFLFRPTALTLTIVMTVLSIAGGFRLPSTTVLYALIFFGLMFIGPGKFSVDKN